MIKRACTECGAQKPLTEEFFYRDIRNKSGLRSNCRDCVKTRSNASHLADPKSHRERTAAWRRAHPDHARALRKAWGQANPGKRKASIARWQAAHPERVRAIMERYLSRFPDANRKAAAKWRKSHPDAVRAAWKNRRARKCNAEGFHTEKEAASLYVQQGRKCAYCRARLTKTERHLDHIVALARGGSNWPSNLQWLCASCNLSKSAKDPIDYAQSRGLLL